MISFDESAAEYHSNHAVGSGAIRDFIRSPQLYLDRINGLLPAKPITINARIL